MSQTSWSRGVSIDVVKGERELHRTEVAAEVTAELGDYVDDLITDLLGDDRKLLPIELAQVVGCFDAIEKSCHWPDQKLDTQEQPCRALRRISSCARLCNVPADRDSSRNRRSYQLCDGGVQQLGRFRPRLLDAQQGRIGKLALSQVLSSRFPQCFGRFLEVQQVIDDLEGQPHRLPIVMK